MRRSTTSTPLVTPTCSRANMSYSRSPTPAPAWTRRRWRARAMAPFFPPKPVGEGTGLGLPQVYGFVKQSGGHIKLYSEVGEGTTVKLYLPRTLREAPKEAPPPIALLLAGTETILLVDDDDTVRATVCSMLEELGYSVLAASSGAQA